MGFEDRRRLGRAATALLLALACWATPGVTPWAGAQEEAPEMAIEVSEERPVRDRDTVRITVSEGRRPAAGARVTAIYRPNSTTSVTQELDPVDSSGTLMWTPTSTGPVTLEVRPAGAAEDAPAATSHTVAVRYGGMPASGLLIMVLAGILLFGGAAWSMYLLLKPPEHAPPVEPPST